MATRSQDSKNRIRLVFLSAIVVMTFGFFWQLLAIQNASSNPNLIREQMVAQKELLELREWDLQFQKCEIQGIQSRCTFLSAGAERRILPDPSGILALLSAKYAGSNVALAEHVFTASERQWLSERSGEVVSFVVPNSVQSTARMVLASGRRDVFGVGVHAHFQVPAEELLRAGGIRLEYEFEGLPWFGPPELSPALMPAERSSAYLALRERQIGSSNLAMVIHIGFPLVVAAIALVLDHSLAIMLLSVVGASQALRSFLALLVNMQLVEYESIKPYLFAVNGLSSALLVLFALELCGLRKFRLWNQVLFVCALSFVGFLVTGASPEAVLQIDHIFDFGAAAVCLGIVGAGLFVTLRESFATLRAEGKSPQDFVAIDRSLTLIKLVVAGFGFGVYGWANAAELWMLQAAPFKNFLDWKQLTLFPALISACLIDVGSTSKRMFVFARQMVAKAMMERELELGREVQQRMLPRRRSAESGWQWRSVYLPATALAGDWYDIRSIPFASGERILAACIADVTGHGAGAALSTGVISSQWGLWCRAMEQQVLPSTAEGRSALLSEAPRKINEGLLALRKNENCTAIFCFFDSAQQTVTVVSAGHPGCFVSNGESLSYVMSRGDRLGVDSENVSWTTETRVLKEDEFVVLFSDGIVPVGKTISSWTGQLVRELRKAERPSLGRILAQQLRENRRVFRVSKAAEDDMTVVAISRTPQA